MDLHVCVYAHKAKCEIKDYFWVQEQISQCQQN